jgi:malate synthase
MTAPGWLTRIWCRWRARCLRRGWADVPTSSSFGPRSRSAPPTCSTWRPRPGEVTEQGLRTDVSVGFQYVSFWLGGRGAAAINSLMEDAATAEISRAQIWQWVRHGATLEDGRTVTADLVREVLDQETAKIREQVGEETWGAGRPRETREIFERVALSDELIEFLILIAYEYLD